MRVLNKPVEIRDFLLLLRERASGDTGKVEETVKKILSDVKNNGDKAVISYAEKFDSSRPKDLRIKSSEITNYAKRADKKIVASLEKAARRIRSFHEMQKEKSWLIEEPGYRRLPANRLNNIMEGSRAGRRSPSAFLGQI